MKKTIKRYHVFEKETVVIAKPAIKPNESEDDYVARCIPWVVSNEGLTGKQAAGKCHGMYQGKEHKKSYKVIHRGDLAHSPNQG